MLRVLVGLLVAGGLLASVYLVSIGAPLEHVPAVREHAWQLRELAFLKAAYDRIQQDLTRPSEASASLEAERERVARQIAETAKLLPPERIPAGLRALLSKTETAPVSPALSGATMPANGQKPDPVEMPAPDLRVGLRLVSVGVSQRSPRAEVFAIDPELREPVVQEPVPQPEERPPRRKPRDAARRTQP